MDSRKICELLEKIYESNKRIEKALARFSKESRTVLAKKGGLASKMFSMSSRIDDLTRHEILKNCSISDPLRKLLVARASIYSQNGEDGIILTLIREIGNPTHRFVEIGCGENGGNSGALAFELGWSGLMLDGNPERIERLCANFQFDRKKVIVRQEWITRDNIENLISKNNMGGEIDLLSIDIDGVDYWVWKEIDICSPRIVITEYNSSFGPDKSVTVPYDAEFKRKPEFRVYFGASLAALSKLGKEKNYRLIGVEPRGVNAIFLRNDVLKEIYPAVEPSDCFKMLDKHVLYKAKLGYKDFYEELKRLRLPIVEV